MNLKSNPIADMLLGANWNPSTKRATGRSKIADMMVITLKRLMLSSLSFPPAPMNFLLRTFLLWKVKLLPIAAPKPAQLKEASVALAKATPPTMGTKVAKTGKEGTSPKKAEDK